MAKANGNGRYGSDKANAVAATFGPVDKQKAAIESAYASAGSDAEREEVRQAVLDHLDPASMPKDRIRELHHAVGIVDPHEAEQLAAQEWDEKFPVILSKPVNTQGAEIQKQIAGLEDRRRRGIRPYDDIQSYSTELRRLLSEQKTAQEEFVAGPMAAYETQQREMDEFSAASRAEMLGVNRSQTLLFVPDDADERDIDRTIGQLDAADRAQMDATPGVKEIRGAQSAEELTQILAGLDGIEVKPRGEGW